jgi:two-component system, NarL family, sensor histidine kinase ComP
MSDRIQTVMILRLATLQHPSMMQSLLLSFGALAILLLPLIAGQQDASLGVWVRQQGSSWIVIRVDDQSADARAGLKVGDIVVALDGVAPDLRRRTDPGLDLSAAQEWTVLREVEYLTLRRSAEPPPWHVVVEPFVMLAIALAFWGIGIFVRIRKPKDELARRFYHLNLAMATVLALSPAAGNGAIWAKVPNVVAFSLLPALFASFFISFSRGDPASARTALFIRGLYISGVACGGVYLLTGLLGSSWYDVARALLLALLVGGLLGGLLILAWGYRRPLAPHIRQQTQIVLVGAAVAVLPLTVLSLVPESLGLPPIVRPQFAALSLIGLPISFACAILRCRFLDLDRAIARSLVYGAMTLLLAGSYALFLHGLNLARLGQDAGDDPFFSLFFFAIMALAFIPIRDLVCRLIDQLIYGDRYDYARTLRAIGDQLISVQPIDEVLSTIASNLMGAMNLRGVAVLLRQPAGGFAVRIASGDAREAVVSQIPLDASTIKRGDDFRGAGSGRWIPLVAHGEESGFLYLGPKRSLAEFSVEDLDLAETVAIANALLVERLQVKVAELELLQDRFVHVQEQERKCLAQDLHDGALHTVLGLVRWLEITEKTLPPACASPKVLGQQLHDLAERGRDAAHELRTICAELYPSELAHLGLIAALQSLVREVNRDENLVVHLSIRDFPCESRLPENVEDTLYRIAREALTNVCRHAEAKVARIELALEDGQIVLTVRDNGRGFTPPTAFSTLLRQGHIGLASMRDRIERLGGTLVIRSSPDRGTAITLRLAVPSSDRQPSQMPGELPGVQA